MEIIDEQLSGGVDVLHRVMSSDADKIRRTQEEIDPKDFDTVIDSIIGAHRIYILGLRSSGVLAGLLSFYFNHIFEDVVNVGAAQGETFEQRARSLSSSSASRRRTPSSASASRAIPSGR